MPRSPATQRRKGGRPSRREVFVAVSERDRSDGGHESLRVTPEAIVLVRERHGNRVTDQIPLAELERIRTRERVGRLELLVALSYLLGASVFFYLMVRLIGHLAGMSLWLVLGVLTFFAAGGVAAAWFGREGVVQFISRGHAKRLEYVVREDERERLEVLESLRELQRSS